MKHRIIMPLAALVIALATPAWAKKLEDFQLDETASAEETDTSLAPSEDPNAAEFQAPVAKKNTKAGKEAKTAKVIIIQPRQPEPRDIPLIEPARESSAQDDVTFVTGGIGDDEREALEAAKPDYNLYITNTGADGAYIGDVRVRICRIDGKTSTEKLSVSAGPLLYVRLPAGKYSLEAVLGEQVLKKSFTVNAKGKTAPIQLVWKTAAE